MDWLEGLGKILVFLSFWFAAPEILGEARLKEYIQSSLTFIGFLFGCVAWLLVLLTAYFGIPQVIHYIPADWLSPEKVQEWGAWIAGLLPWGSLVFPLAAVAGGATRDFFSQSVAEPLLKRLSQNDGLRRQLVFLGAGLFVIGSGLDFVTWLARRL